MPRAVDPSLAGGGLPLTNDPLVRLGHNVVPQPMDLLKLLQQMLEGLPDAIENLLFPAIEQLTGIDMSMFLPLLKVMDLDFSSPQAFLESLMRMLVVMPGALMILLPGLIDRLIAPDSSEMMTSLLTGLIPSLAALPTLLFQLADALIKSGVGLLSTLSPLNALNLFNIIPVSSLGLVGYSHIGDSNPNLLANPSFDGAESVQGSGIWFYDDTVGRTTPGSVYTVADGTLKQLISNPIPVSPDQKLDMSAYCEWSGLVYTGTTPIQVRVMKLLSNTRIGPDDVAAPVSPAANQTTWLRFGAEYVAPAGCDAVCLLLTVNATATAGTIRFDDGDVHKTGKLKIPWVDGLPEELQATLNQIQALLDSIFQTFAQTAAVGNTLDDLMMALASIPFGNILGIGGPANVGGSIQGTWDQLISGLVGSVGGVGAGLADLFNVGFGVSSSASKGRMSWDILGVRNNKSIDSGMLATSEANFALSKIALLPTAPTIAVTQSASTIAFLRMAESNDKGVVSWLGSGTTNITACYVNIWQMDPATGDMTLVHRSHNIIANLSTSMAWVIYEMPGMLATKAGEVYGIEITIQGIGTHTVTGMTTWIPDHPATFPKSYAATRNSGTGTPPDGTVIASAAVAYSSSIPWIEWGITVGAATIAPHSAETTFINSVGTTSLSIPAWANFVDVIAVGAGGAGGIGGVFYTPGLYGGGAGEWATATWAREAADFTGTTLIDVTVGAGGSSAADPDGDPTVVAIPGHTVTAAGGLVRGNTGSQMGEAAGSQLYNDMTYVGGGVQNTQGASGAIPGGGGASGEDFGGGPGGHGAHGAAWVVMRQT